MFYKYYEVWVFRGNSSERKQPEIQNDANFHAQVP